MGKRGNRRSVWSCALRRSTHGARRTGNSGAVFPNGDDYWFRRGMAEGGQGRWLRLISCLPVFLHACLMVIDSAVLKNVSDELQAYVYMLVDPDSGVPFYVGKGHRLRYGDHVAEALASMAGALNPVEESPEEESGKVAKIKEILNRGTGSEPEVWIIRYGLQKAEYTAAEAALIDLLMTFPVVPRRGSEARIPLGCQGQLTNARRESARGHGITLLRTLIDDYAAPPLVTRVPLLLITLNGSQDMPDGEEMADGRLRYWPGGTMSGLSRQSARSRSRRSASPSRDGGAST
jgi:hypothetical protein